jgi:hypothetical protein
VVTRRLLSLRRELEGSGTYDGAYQERVVVTCERDGTDDFMFPFFDIFIVSDMGNEVKGGGYRNVTARDCRANLLLSEVCPAQ